MKRIKVYNAIVTLVCISVLIFANFLWTDFRIRQNDRELCDIYSALDRPVAKDTPPDTIIIRKAFHKKRIKNNCPPPLIKAPDGR